MRTTLTLDDDVAAALERLRESEGLTLKAAVNRVLRRGFQALEEPREPQVPYRTPSWPAGRCRVGSVIDVSEALAAAEGEDFR